MSRFLIRASISIALVVVPVGPALKVTRTVTAQTVPATQASAESFGAVIQKILSIKGTDADVMPPLKEAVKSQKDSAKRADSLAKLTEAILNGPDPLALVKKITSASEIDTSAFPDWGAGGPNDWQSIADELWKMASVAQDKDAKKASDLAKASLMMSAMGDFVTGWRGEMLLHLRDPYAEKILGISHDQFGELKKVFQERLDQDSLWLKEAIASYKLMDSITEGAGDDVDVEKSKAIMEHFDNSFRKGPAQLGYRWMILRQTWQFLNLAKQRKAKEAQEIVKGQLEKWKHDFDDPDIQRWITQALTRDGPPPGRMHAEGTMK